MQIFHRKSLRLREYDYSQPGYYFITICTQDRECLFGKINNNEMLLNNAGKMILMWWKKLKEKFNFIDLDVCVVMPNHFHGIIVIQDLHVGAHMGAPLQKMIQWFKTITTNEYIRCVKQNAWKKFNNKLWQRNYYEHIIRTEKSLEEIREYIIYNPHNWEKDALFIK